MSDDAPLPYSPLYIRFWTAFAIVMGSFLLLCFVCGDHLLHLAGGIWHFLRYLCRGII